MNRIPLNAQERETLGKNVKLLRADGIIPGHVFGNQTDGEHVSVSLKDFMPVLKQAGETGLIDLKIGEDKIRPVLIRELQYDPIKGKLLHIGFYQVNLKEKVTVPVPIVLIGEEAESVRLGETVVLQNLSEVQVEALPTDLVENFEVDITKLQAVDDAITVGELSYDRETLTILAEPEEVVVKLAPAITEEMKKLLEEQEQEAAAAAEAVAAEAGAEGEKVEGAEGVEGETPEGEGGEISADGGEAPEEEKAAE